MIVKLDVVIMDSSCRGHLLHVAVHLGLLGDSAASVTRVSAVGVCVL